MKPEELKNSVIFNTLKKNKKAQKSALRLAKTEDWIILRQFVAQVKQVLMEASFSVDNLDELKKYKHLIYGMESIILLPSLVELVKETKKKDEIKKEEEKREAARRKFNPGSFIRTQVEKVRKVVR